MLSSKNYLRMTALQKPILLLISCLLFFPLQSCNKLDEDGGYYDEETKTYKYVKITKRGVKKSNLQVVSPSPDKQQNIQGVVTRIDDDAKSIWLQIHDRHPYMILAERLSGSNRNDKTKELRIQLRYISPSGSVTQGKEFRKKWRSYARNKLGEQLVKNSVLVEINYEEKARKLWGTVFKVIKTSKGDRVRNINLWAIQQGLSYYFIDHGTSPEDKKFKDAQMIARKFKHGLWQYR